MRPGLPRQAGAAEVPDDTSSFPVDGVSRDDCLEFLGKLTKLAGTKAVFAARGKFAEA